MTGVGYFHSSQEIKQVNKQILAVMLYVAVDTILGILNKI